MKNFIIIISILTIVSCGKDGKAGKDGVDVTTISGVNSIPVVIDFVEISPGLSCQNGGISIFTFKDENLNSLFEEGEDILKIKAICHGLNGLDGTSGTDGTSSTVTLESITSNDQCPQGGVRISSNTSGPVVVCNGVNGLNGEQGIPGVQGIPGIAGINGQNGIDGTKIIPVKFCPGDDSRFPEYGLMIGDELFAVYWGTTPASPKQPQAFLAKLGAGNYMSTGGKNCLFSVL